MPSATDKPAGMPDPIFKFGEGVTAALADVDDDLSRIARDLHSSDGVFYHYTSGQGLLGIVSSNSLWMSDSYFMNDSSEVGHSVGIFEEAFDLLKPGDLTSDVWPVFQNAIRVMREQMQASRPLIFSMSTGKDLLNQWRYYGNDTVAYAIGFNSRELGEIMCDDNVCTYAPLLYDRWEAIQECRDHILRHRAVVGRLLATHSLEDEDTANLIISSALAGRLFARAAFLKHEGFKAEQEVRLIVDLASHANPEVFEFRSSKFGLIPFLRAYMPNGAILPIVKIVIGPTPYQEAARTSVELLLRKHGHENVSTEFSTVPFRQ